MISSIYDKKKGILITKKHGIITLNDIIEDIILVGQNTDLPENLKILTDVTEAEYRFRESEIPILVKYVKETLRKFESVKEALIQNDPYVTALSMIYQFNLKEFKNFKYKVFSSSEFAYRWLNL